MRRSAARQHKPARIDQTPRRRMVPRVIAFGIAAALGLAAPLSASASGYHPIAFGESWTVDAGTTYYKDVADLVANDLDPDGGPLSWVSFSTYPQHGTITKSPTSGTYNYKPDASYNGSDSFTYRIRDAQYNISNLATIKIDVLGFRPVDDFYTIHNSDVLKVPQDAPSPLSNDVNPNGGILQMVFIGATPLHGTFNHGGSGWFDYDPDPGFVGVVRFAYQLKSTNAVLSKDLGFVDIKVIN